MSKKNVFKIGDTVVLKSGGPVMTVKSEKINAITKEVTGYYCQWFAGKKLEQGDFPSDSLESEKKDSK